jgi:CubicO group peptidase (beta-lactamase class C family)
MKAPFITLLLISFPFIVFSQNIRSIHLKMDSFEKELGFSGVVLITKGDSILLHKGYGYNNKEKSTKTDKNTVFQMASVTKSFTGVAIMKLAEQGKLSLQDSIGKYFYSVANKGACITIHQLLVHQSVYLRCMQLKGKQMLMMQQKKY